MLARIQAAGRPPRGSCARRAGAPGDRTHFPHGERTRMATREQILGLLLECIQDQARLTGRAVTAAEGTPLLGAGSPLDSLGLVMVVTDFESRLNQTFDAELVLASEQAMSMSQSPFRTVTALVDYAAGLLGAAA
jgi:hypothetical protein